MGRPPVIKRGPYKPYKKRVKITRCCLPPCRDNETMEKIKKAAREHALSTTTKPKKKIPKILLTKEQKRINHNSSNRKSYHKQKNEQFLIALRQSNGDEKVAKRIMKKSIDTNKTTKQQRRIGTTKTVATPIIAKDAAADLVKPNLLSDDATVLTKGIQNETIEVIDDENDDKDDVNNDIIEIEESNNENSIELLDDCDDKSNDVGNDDNENRTIEIETFNENIIDLIDDDDDDDSGGDVVEKAPAEEKYDDDNEGIEFVGSKGINPLSDFPHSREDCVKNLFRIDPAKFCHQCYCYVCDMNAKDCPKWEDNHCFAQSTDRIWKQRRSAARSKRKSSKEKILHRALRNIGTSICMVVSSTTDLPTKRRRIDVNYRT